MREALVKAWIRNHQLISFFALSYVLMFGVLFGYMALAPGQPLRPWSLVWFVSIFSPSISAVAVAAIVSGRPAVGRLFGGFTRWQVGWGWYLAAAFIFLGPLAIALIYGALGNPVTGLRPGVTIPSLLGTVLFTFFSGPVAEEHRRQTCLPDPSSSSAPGSRGCAPASMPR
jgi:hypothetical protein